MEFGFHNCVFIASFSPVLFERAYAFFCHLTAGGGAIALTEGAKRPNSDFDLSCTSKVLNV